MRIVTKRFSILIDPWRAMRSPPELRITSCCHRRFISYNYHYKHYTYITVVLCTWYTITLSPAVYGRNEPSGATHSNTVKGSLVSLSHSLLRLCYRFLGSVKVSDGGSCISHTRATDPRINHAYCRTQQQQQPVGLTYPSIYFFIHIKCRFYHVRTIIGLHFNRTHACSPQQTYTQDTSAHFQEVCKTSLK